MTNCRLIYQDLGIILETNAKAHLKVKAKFHLRYSNDFNPAPKDSFINNLKHNKLGQVNTQ